GFEEPGLVGSDLFLSFRGFAADRGGPRAWVPRRHSGAHVPCATTGRSAGGSRDRFERFQRPAQGKDFDTAEDSTMEFMTGTETGGPVMPPGVTSINDLRSQKRVSRTLSKAVSLHLEGKLESAARLLGKAI